MTDVTVNQLTSKSGWISRNGTYLNVDEKDGYVGVWGNINSNKAVLAQRDETYCLYTFDNNDFYKEWMEENLKEWDFILTLSDVSEVINNASED
jgi:hypothetical protein